MKEDRMMYGRCRQLVSEYEDLLEQLKIDLVNEERGRPNNGTDAFMMSKQTIETQGFEKGIAALLGRIRKYAGKQ